MAQWVAIGLTALVATVSVCVIWGKFTERLDYMKGEIINLQNSAQTQEERELTARGIAQQFEAHEKVDDLRFANLQQTIEGKLNQILSAVTNFHR